MRPCCCMVLLHGTAAWRCCMVLLHGAAACCYMLLLHGAVCCCYMVLLLLLLQQQQFFNIWNRGGRKSSAGDIWQISGNPISAATGGRRRVSARTLGAILAIKWSFRRRIIISLQRQLRGLNFQLGYDWMSLTRPFLLGPVFLWTSLQCSGG